LFVQQFLPLLYIHIACRSEFDGLNLTSALAGNITSTSENIDSRRRSVRLAEKSNAQ
jgi:hypothetical protein